MIKSLLIAIVIAIATALPAADLVSAPPGMIHTVIYSGYLNTSVQGRKMHYVFVEANVSDPSNASLAVWLNGGPGCSSLTGMLQQNGPYIVGNDYNQGDMLTKNEYAWSKVANILYLQSPSIVGFSSEKNSSYKWTDQQTAKDAYAALKDFIFNKAQEFANRSLFITGQSYAGKYIPDLADLILANNRNTTARYIYLRGIMVGNGVMNFQNDELDKSQIQFMIDHGLVPNRLELIYLRACSRDYNSPRCRFVRFELNILSAYLNPYNIYQVCKRNRAESNQLLQMLNPERSVRAAKIIDSIKGVEPIPDCPSDSGAIKYWNLNKFPFHVDSVNKTWSVCAHLNYQITMRGSLEEYKRILLNKQIKIWLYSGDIDDVVPYTDTQKNVEKFDLDKAGQWSSWNVGDQHAGFYQVYDRNMTVITVKGAGHMVPEDQPKSVFQLFYNFVNNKGVNNQIF